MNIYVYIICMHQLHIALMYYVLMLYNIQYTFFVYFLCIIYIYLIHVVNIKIFAYF